MMWRAVMGTLSIDYIDYNEWSDRCAFLYNDVVNLSKKLLINDVRCNRDMHKLLKI